VSNTRRWRADRFSMSVSRESAATAMRLHPGVSIAT